MQRLLQVVESGGPRAVAFCVWLVSGMSQGSCLLEKSQSQDCEFFALDAEDDTVGLVDADTPPAAQVVAKGFWIADAGDAVTVDALQEQVDVLERLGVLSLPDEIFYPGIVVPDLTHESDFQRRSSHVRTRSCEDPFRVRDVRVRAG